MFEKEISEKILADTEPILTLPGTISILEEAIRNGDSQRAYELSMQATQAAPNDAEVWFLRASLAPSLEERILCVNRLNELQPDHPDRYNIAFFTLKELLDIDPYLAYVDETEQLYRVLHPDHRVLSIPKKRSAAAPPPHQRRDQLSMAYRWLGFAIFGLLFAGVLTLIFAPLAAWSAINAERTMGSHAGQVRSAIVLFSSSTLFVIGLLFSVLLVLHLIG